MVVLIKNKIRIWMVEAAPMSVPGVSSQRMTQLCKVSVLLLRFYPQGNSLILLIIHSKKKNNFSLEHIVAFNHVLFL